MKLPKHADPPRVKSRVESEHTKGCLAPHASYERLFRAACETCGRIYIYRPAEVVHPPTVQLVSHQRSDAAAETQSASRAIARPTTDQALIAEHQRHAR